MSGITRLLTPPLAPAFCAAGVATVVAPIWPIQVSTGLEFVKRLVDRDMGPSIGEAWGAVLGQDPGRFASFALYRP